MKRITLFFCILGLWFDGSVCGQGLTTDQIDSLVEASIMRMPAAGIAILVIKDGETVHMRGYGNASISKPDPVDVNTLFSIGSNTKAFVSMAIAILADEGKIRWDDKVIRYIPEFRMFDPYVTEQFTIVDLLTHRSGLEPGTGDLMFIPDGSDFTVKDILQSLQHHKPMFDFRTRCGYDNILYEVAGEVISRVSGMPFTVFIEDRVMKPLGMKASAAGFRRIKAGAKVAMPHSVIDDTLKQFSPYVENESLGAAGGIWSNLADLSQWMLMHLNQGRFGPGLRDSLVSVDNLYEILKPHSFEGFRQLPKGPSKIHFYTYGLGWEITDLNGYVAYSHSGGMPGMLSRTVLIPEIRLGVVVLSNTDPGGYADQSLSRAITDAYVGRKSDRIGWLEDYILHRQNFGDSITNAVWNIVRRTNPADLNLPMFSGKYKDNWFGDVHIEIRDGQLWFVSKRSPKLNGPMFFYKDNTFVVKWEYRDMICDAFATFILSEEGVPVAIKMKAISPNTDFSFDFQHLDLKRIY